MALMLMLMLRTALLLPPCSAPQRYVGMDQRQPAPMQRGPGFEYRYLTEFQSHEPEFDYLKSLEIEEKINKVRWVRSSNNTKHIIATNDKTIKLWKVRTAVVGAGAAAAAAAAACLAGYMRRCAGPQPATRCSVWRDSSRWQQPQATRD